MSYERGWNTAGDSNIAPTDANLTDQSPWTWTPSAGPQETTPNNNVNWYEAYAFCIWDGGFLPSETEWEYAAAGGSQQRCFPWGSFYAIGTGTSYCVYGCNLGGACVAPVGTASAGAGLWGHLDLGGDMGEWEVDSYAAYQSCTDCEYVADADSSRVYRGGDAWNPQALCQAWYSHQRTRRDLDATARSPVAGFRCARSP